MAKPNRNASADMQPKKIKKVMHEFKTGTLHSGKKGPVVKSRQQAIAIAMSEAGMAKKKPAVKKPKTNKTSKKKGNK